MNLPEHLDSPSFLIESMLLIFLAFFGVFSFCLSSFYILCQMLHVSLDCPVVTVTSFFSNVYSELIL